MLDFIKEDK